MARRLARSGADPRVAPPALSLASLGSNKIRSWVARNRVFAVSRATGASRGEPEMPGFSRALRGHVLRMRRD